uniref:RRM domain-containing protein n=1 Tax=Steinernema glaseri TaxID=37863 RepID=A0A1I7YGQ8_9BILA
MMDAKANDLSTEMSELFRKHAETAGDWCDVVDDDMRDDQHKQEDKVEDPRPSQPLPPPTYNHNYSQARPAAVQIKRNVSTRRTKPPSVSEQETLSVYIWNVPEYATEEDVYYYFGGDDDVIDVLRLDRGDGHPLTGIIKFKCKEAFERAVKLNMKSFMNRNIRVSPRKITNNNVGAGRSLNCAQNRNAPVRSNHHQQNQSQRFHVTSPSEMHVPPAQQTYSHPRHTAPVPQHGRNMHQGHINQNAYGNGRRQHPVVPPVQQMHRHAAPVASSAPAAHPAPVPVHTAPTESEPPVRKTNIFGEAKPVDTSAKMLEIFNRQSHKKDKEKERHKKEKKEKSSTSKRTSECGTEEETVADPVGEAPQPLAAIPSTVVAKKEKSADVPNRHNQKKEKEKPKQRQVTVLKRSSECTAEDEAAPETVVPVPVQPPPEAPLPAAPKVEKVVESSNQNHRGGSEKLESEKEIESDEKTECPPKPASECDAGEEAVPDPECHGDHPSAETPPSGTSKKKKKSKKNKKKNVTPNVLHGNKFEALHGVSTD